VDIKSDLQPNRSSSIKLTKRYIDDLQPRDKRYDIWDADLRGFGLRIEPTGTKTFIVRYRAEGGGRSAPRRFMTLGRMGVLTPEQARGLAKKTLGFVAHGKDPAHELKLRRNEMTIADLIDRYAQTGCVVQRGKRRGTAMKAVTKRYTLARLRNHVLPLLGRKRVSDVRIPDIVRLSLDVAAGKTAIDKKQGARSRVIVKGGLGAARKVVRDLSAVFTFALSQEICIVNPCTDAPINKTDNTRKRYLKTAELKALGLALKCLEEEGANPKALNIIRLWVLTGCRRTEIESLRWEYVDFDLNRFCFKDSKTGESTRPLGLPTIDLLTSINKTDHSPFVFPSEHGDTYYQGTKKVFTKAMAKAGLSGVTPHVLRHTLGSTAASTGESLLITATLLGHSNVRSSQIYAHVQADPSSEAADRVTKKLAIALNKSEPGA
jgi:integrase